MLALGLAAPSGGCAKSVAPERVALEYARAVFASDASAIYRLVSDDDRRARDETTFRGQQAEPRGFARELVHQLASYITATPVSSTIDGRRGTVKLKLTLPDANAPAISGLARDWDDEALERLSFADRRRIVDQLAELHRAGTLPTIDGEETFELVKQEAGWRVFANWAGGVHLHFAATVDRSVPLEVSVAPSDVTVNPGDRVRVTVHARNRTSHDVTTRVGHRIEPAAQSQHLALVQCPLFVPITLRGGETREFTSVYLVLADVPRTVKGFAVTYEIRAVETGAAFPGVRRTSDIAGHLGPQMSSISAASVRDRRHRPVRRGCRSVTIPFRHATLEPFYILPTTAKRHTVDTTRKSS